MVEAAIQKNTKVLYCESVSNPLLEVADIQGLAKLAKKYNLKLVVDNTFSPLSVSPAKLGADVVIHSLTKFINSQVQVTLTQINKCCTFKGAVMG